MTREEFLAKHQALREFYDILIREAAERLDAALQAANDVAAEVAGAEFALEQYYQAFGKKMEAEAVIAKGEPVLPRVRL